MTKESKNFHDAERYCREVGHGYLTEIQTSEENNFVARLAWYGNVWIGYNDRAQEGKWIWTNTGESESYTNWNTGEPNNDGDQDCAFLWSGEEKALWEDIECLHEQWFVCEKGRPCAVQWSPLMYNMLGVLYGLVLDIFNCLVAIHFPLAVGLRLSSLYKCKNKVVGGSKGESILFPSFGKQANTAFLYGPSVWQVADRGGSNSQPFNPKAPLTTCQSVKVMMQTRSFIFLSIPDLTS